MSYDGYQRIVIALADDRDDVARAVLHKKPAAKIGFAFGFGETHPVRPESIDAIVALGWTAIDVVDLEDELDDSLVVERIIAEVRALRFIAAEDIERARDALDAIVKQVSTMRTALGPEARTEASALREVLLPDATDADAVSDAQRVAYVAAQLARVVRKAAAKSCAVVVAWSE